MRQYEALLILPAEADESVVGGTVDRIKRAIGEGGEIGALDRWGRRRLAYEIAHQSEGYYLLVNFTADPATITELERVLHLADDVIRFKVAVKAA